MTVHLYQKGQWEEIPADESVNLYRLLTERGAFIDAPCGGRCFCGKCRMRVAGGGDILPVERDFLSAEELASGWRLACALTVKEGLRIWLEDIRAAEIQVEGGLAGEEVDPVVTVTPILLSSATLEDPADDLTRMERTVGVALDIPDPRVLGELRQAYAVLYEGRQLLAGRKDRAAYGVAVDIGTTTVVAYLLDLLTGRQLGALSALNIQRSFGADVITRCTAAATAQGLAGLKRGIRAQIAEMIAALCAQNDLLAGDIYHIAIVGNTVMVHLLLGAPVDAIAASPFAPVIARSIDLRADSLDLGCSRAVVTVLPAIAGYVGADTVGAAIACALDRDGSPRLLIDIGTNGEIVLAVGNSLLCCAAAAGPAFEGAHIQCGMGGVAGAIAKIRLEDKEIRVDVIGGDVPAGLCGSGLIDAVATLLTVGAIDETGRLDKEHLPERHFDYGDKPAFRLTDDVFLIQKDIRETQLAKAAIATGVHILLREAGIRPQDIEQTYLAGGFGNHIDPLSACSIGLLPSGLLPSVCAVGNAAGAGARLALLNRNTMIRAEALRRRMQYIELSTRIDFQDLYVENMLFLK